MILICLKLKGWFQIGSSPKVSTHNITKYGSVITAIFCECAVVEDWCFLFTIGFLASRVSDPYPDPHPDPHASALIWVAGSGSGSRRAKMTHKNRKKYRIFMFWSAGCSLFRTEGFSCSLGVLYGGLGISKLQFLIKKIKIKFPAVNFSQF